MRLQCSLRGCRTTQRSSDNVMFGPSSTEAVGLPNTLETRRDAVSWPQQQTELFQFPYYPLFLFTLSPCAHSVATFVSHRLYNPRSSRYTTQAMSMLSQTLQGALLSITSNVLAQGLSAYKDSVRDIPTCFSGVPFADLHLLDAFLSQP